MPRDRPAHVASSLDRRKTTILDTAAVGHGGNSTETYSSRKLSLLVLGIVLVFAILSRWFASPSASMSDAEVVVAYEPDEGASSSPTTSIREVTPSIAKIPAAAKERVLVTSPQDWRRVVGGRSSVLVWHAVARSEPVDCERKMRGAVGLAGKWARDAGFAYALGSVGHESSSSQSHTDRVSFFRPMTSLARRLGYARLVVIDETISLLESVGLDITSVSSESDLDDLYKDEPSKLVSQSTFYFRLDQDSEGSEWEAHFDRRDGALGCCYRVDAEIRVRSRENLEDVERALGSSVNLLEECPEPVPRAIHVEAKRVDAEFVEIKAAFDRLTLAKALYLQRRSDGIAFKTIDSIRARTKKEYEITRVKFDRSPSRTPGTNEKIVQDAAGVVVPVTLELVSAEGQAGFRAYVCKDR